MKKYLAILHADSRMSSIGDYKLVKEEEIKSIKLFGEFVRLYELVQPEPLSKKQGLQLGLRYLE